MLTPSSSLGFRGRPKDLTNVYLFLSVYASIAALWHKKGYWRPQTVHQPAFDVDTGWILSPLIVLYVDAQQIFDLSIHHPGMYLREEVMGVQPNLVRPGLYLSSSRTEVCQDVLSQHAITHILQASGPVYTASYQLRSGLLLSRPF